MIVFPASGAGTRIVLHTADGRLPVVIWLGWWDGPLDDLPVGPGSPLLVEHSRGAFTRPGLRGCRGAGRDWSTAFRLETITEGSTSLVVDAVDQDARLAVRTEVEALPGGALRARHALTNRGDADYLLDGLEIAVPVPDNHSEVLDFTGRHEHERTPQRHPIRDGLWLRESRQGRPGLDAASALVTGPAGFGFGHGSVVQIAVGASGNSVLGLQRDGATGTVLIAGELLLPGEVVLAPDEQYVMPWVYVAAGTGLDEVAGSLHTWQRTLPRHPREQPVTLNVWEAVYFDHDLGRLRRLADLAARAGVERFVLDDGWFHARRHDRAGLGDWWVDPDVWPDGLTPLAEYVRSVGMQFGLWLEPEMVNPDSDLFRAHPDWVLSVPGRLPLPQRDQQVLDLTNPAAYDHVLTAIDAVLAATPVDYVKWDHNRELLDAGRLAHGGVPGVHAQTRAYYRLLDELTARHPGLEVESCASGGGRIDLGVIERVERFWTSDVTDALARQPIQRWTAQLVAPEYLGAHVSAPTSHQTGRTLPLDFRAATALFGSFGIEWDLTSATDDELARLAEWVQHYKRWRPLLHTGRVVRLDVADPAVLAHGVVAADRRSALLAHVQLDESAHNRGVTLRVPGLDPALPYRARWAVLPDLRSVSRSVALDPSGPLNGETATGAVLGRIGLWLPRRHPETVTLFSLEATQDRA